MRKLNAKPTVAIFMLPLLVAGCAQLERLGGYDETKFPYRLIGQDSGLIPDANTNDTSISECTAVSGLTKEEAYKRELTCKKSRYQNKKNPYKTIL